MKAKNTRAFLSSLLLFVLIVGSPLAPVIPPAPIDSPPLAAVIPPDATETEAPIATDELHPILGASFTDFNPAVTPVAIGNVFFFAARTTPPDWQLWRSDGTEAGTIPLLTSQGTPPVVGPFNPESLVVLNGFVYFSAEDATGDRELWRSNGTLQGTSRIKDINTGGSSSPDHLTVLGTSLYFAATDGRGRELWKSNGTRNGTVLVKDINPGGDSNPDHLAIVGNTLYFAATDGTRGIELWKSRGTARTTLMVADINPNPAPLGDSSPDHLTAVGTFLYFVADNGADGRELWKTNGTALGTFMLGNISPLGDSLPDEITNIGAIVYFSASNGAGRELWRTDGTVLGTNNLTTGAANPLHLTPVGTTLYFSATDALRGTELWKSDITGTAPVEDINTGPGDSSPRNLIGFSGSLIFSADDGGGEALWTSDGTAAGTSLLNQVIPQKLTIVENTILFAGDDGTAGQELWITNGTVEGTSIVRDINLTAGVGSNPDLLTPVNGRLFFTANDGAVKLWVSDGTRLGTNPVSAPDVPANSSNPRNFASRLNTVFFSANNGTLGRELWRSDGSLTSTKMVRDIFKLAPSSDPTSLTVVADGTLYFAAVTVNEGRELWKSDGTNAGTVLVADISPGNTDSSPSEFTSFGTAVYFAAFRNGTAGLWRTDGIPNGATELVKAFTGPGGSSATELTVFGDALYFVAEDGSNGRVLWRSDGTQGGTVPVTDASDNTISNPAELTLVGGNLFFVAQDALRGRELWRVSGGVGEVVEDIVPGTGSSQPQNLAAGTFTVNGIVTDVVYFTATRPAEGFELWRSNGEPLGTALVTDICPGVCSSTPQSLVNVNGVLVFSAEGTTGDRELWRHDGRTGDTALVRNINPGGSSSPDRLTVVGSKVLFVADDGTHGLELWTYNVADNRIVIVKDINPGLLGSDPQNLFAVGNFVYFSADNGGPEGRELWRSDGTALRTRMLRNIWP